MTFWLNGEWRDDATAIRIDDRGLLLGDGAFETVLVRNGAPAFLDRHLQRLENALAVLSIDASPPQTLRAIIRDLALKNDVNDRDAVLRMTITRGPGARGLGAAGAVSPTTLMTLTRSSPATKERRLIVSEFMRSVAGLAATFKAPAYIDNILAYNDALANGADDAVMLNVDGAVACATTANVFVIGESGVVSTPPATDGALPGVVRGVLLECAGAVGVNLVEKSLSPDELQGGAVFLTNSLIGLTPARVGASADVSRNEIFKRLVSCYETALANDLRQAGET